jgi:hypothetical protein
LGFSILISSDFSPLAVIALHHAARQGFGDIVSLLMERGANVDAKALQGKTPLHQGFMFRDCRTPLPDSFFFFFCAYSRTVRAAASRGSDFVIRKLMHGGADLNCRTTDERQWSPLHFAVFGDFPGTIKLLCGERCLCVTARARVITNHLFAILFARRTWRQCQHQRSA